MKGIKRLMETKIKLISAEYLPQLAEISLSAFGKRDIENFERMLTDKNYIYFLLVNEYDIVLGYAGLLVVDSMAELVSIAVDDNYRHMGYGTFLLAFAIKYLKEKKFKGVFLEVRTDNDVAKKLYKKFGFVPFSIRKNFYDGCVDGVNMRLEF